MVVAVVKELAEGDCHVTHVVGKDSVTVHLAAAEVVAPGPETWPGIAAAELAAAGPAALPHSAGPGIVLAAVTDLVTGLAVLQLAAAAPVLWLSMLLVPEIRKYSQLLKH